MEDWKQVRLAVVGSRDFNNLDFMVEALGEIIQANRYDVTELVSGGARGADKLGAEVGAMMGWKVTEFLPDWEQHGKSAGYMRNEQIVRGSDVVVAFWDEVSRGTKHSIDISKKLGKILHVIKYK